MEQKTNWQFVPLHEQDIDAVMALQQSVSSQLPDPRWYFTSTAEEFTEDLRSGSMVGIWQQGELIALGSGSMSRADASVRYAVKVGEDPAHTFDFRDVMVDPAYRRQGIHTALLAYFKEKAQTEGCKSIYCTVDPENMPSRSSFEKAGYKAILQKPAYDGRPRVYYKLVLE